ncbi:MAG: hypothetical protein HY556_11045 [Euryarchaeota archaeon]|nr:hypothetical protein [Euryarchaeota archaeon]
MPDLVGDCVEEELVTGACEMEHRNVSNAKLWNDEDLIAKGVLWVTGAYHFSRQLAVRDYPVVNTSPIESRAQGLNGDNEDFWVRQSFFGHGVRA